MHLRNTLAKGMDAESYSLHTFEALLSQSMENLGEFYVPALSLVLVFGFWFLLLVHIRFAVFVVNLVVFHSIFVLVGVVVLSLSLHPFLCLSSLERFIQPSLIEFLISLNSPLGRSLGSCPRQCLNQCPSRVIVAFPEGWEGVTIAGGKCSV